MRKTLTILLLCVLTLSMILCSCDKVIKQENEGEDIIKKVEIREEQDKLTVVYEDGYERSYSLTQPIEVFVEKDNTRSARAVGITFPLFVINTGTSTGISTGGISFVTGEYNGNVSTGDYIYSTGEIVFSTGVIVEGDITYVVSQMQSAPTTRHFEHDGKKYEDCSGELLNTFRTKTVLIDFVTGYEEEPFDAIYANGFAKFENLEAIILPASVKKVGQKAFDGCTKLTTVYFCGTEEEWGTVEMAETEVKDKDGKEPIETTPNHLTTCTVYFYSETEPTATGNYWHFVDGKPIAW